MAPSIPQRLCVILLAAAASLYQPLSQSGVHAIALPELVNPALLQPAHQINPIRKRAEWDPDCTTTTSVPMATVAGGGTSEDGAVTITVTVFVPATTSRASTSTRGDSTTSGTRTISASNASATNTQTSSSAPTPTQTSSALAGQQAQQLNVAYIGIQATDSCTAGQRACIDNMLAECVASSNEERPKWVTKACPVTPSNEGMTCAAVPFVSSPSPSTTSSASTTTSTGLAGYEPIPLSSSVAIGCFAKENIAQSFASAGVDGASGGMFPPGFGSSALARLQFRLDRTLGLALIAGLIMW